MYGLLATIVVTLGLIYIIHKIDGVITVKVVHAVEKPEPVQYIAEDEPENPGESLDAILKAVQDSINTVNGTGGRRNEQ